MRKLALASIYLYFFVCPLEFVFNTLMGSSVKYIALFSVLCIGLYYVADRKVKLKIGIVQYALLAWVLLEAASLLWTSRSSVTFDRVETYLLMTAYVLLISVFPFEEKELKTVAFIYALGSVAALVTLFVSGDLLNGGNFEGRRTIRIRNKWQDPNALAAYLTAGMLYFLDKLFSKKWYAIPSVFITGAFIFGILQTGSRGALISIIVTVIVMLFVRAEKKARIKVVIAVAALSVVTYVVIAEFLPESLFNRLFNLETYIGGSGRIRLWVAAMEEVFKRPLFGNGIASYLSYFDQAINGEIAMHNTYLCVLFEVGFVGLVLFVIPFLVALYYSHKKKDIYAFSMVLCNMGIVFFLDSIYIRYIWNALMLGIIAYNIYKSQNPNKTAIK